MMRPLLETLYNDPRMLALSGQRDRDLQKARLEIEDLLMTPEWIEP